MENSFLQESQMLQERESLSEQRRRFYQEKANFEEERRKFTEAAIQLGKEVGVVLLYLSRVARKGVFGVSDQVRLKLGCTTTEDG